MYYILCSFKHNTAYEINHLSTTDDCDVFFFFQAEDGIRDLTVTGVQTCALPILFLLSGLLFARESTFDGKSMEKKSFGVTADGSSAGLYVLTNKNGAQVSITNLDRKSVV